MSERCLDIGRISRYLNRTAQPEDALGVERHARACVQCHDKLHRMKRHAESLFEEYPDPRAEPQDVCPSPIQLDHFARASLSERQLARIQQHVATCPACLQRLRRLRDDAPVPGQPLYRTRPADLDVRFTAQGLRVCAGAALVQWEPASLVRRLGLQDLEPSSHEVIAGKSLRFTRAVPGGALHGYLGISSPEALRVGVRVEGAAAGVRELCLWSRDRVWARLPLAAADETSVLLGPGHYFVGPAALQEPWLAVAVEEDVPSPTHLAELAYAHCAHGKIGAAVRCLESIDPARIPDIQAMRDLCTQFARAYGDTVADLLQPSHRPQPEPPPEPKDLHVDRCGPDRVVEIIELIRAVQRRAEHAAAGPGGSRRALVCTYGKFMRRMRQHLDSVVSRTTGCALER